MPDTFDIKIDKNSELQSISKDINHFSDLIAKHKYTHISTSDGNWGHTFTLDTNSKLANKKIYFSSKASLDSHIRYANNSITVKSGESILLVSDKFGFWRASPDETPASQIQDEIQYIENGWSITIPKEYIKPGIKFHFSNNNNNGILPNIKIGAPNTLIINTIDIGMLTPYRDQFTFQNSAELHRQYFQNIPISNLVVSKYMPIQLNEVVLSDGTHYTTKSAVDGGEHNGDMREEITKDLISDGINLANYGVNWSAPGENQFLPIKQVTIHNSIGNYKNGIQVHGLSGGAGKATLYHSTGNEFSHELGHNFHLGDYHNGFYGGVHAHANQKNSTWGWDADNNFFIPNFEKNKNNQLVKLGQTTNETEAAQPYLEHSMSKDAMSSGSPYHPEYNDFTLHTPSSLAAIQKDLENRVVFSTDSATGYRKWNAKTQKMEDYELPIDERSISLNVDLRDHTDVTIDEMNNFFDDDDFIIINSHNAHYTPNIYIPEASESNKEKIIKITRHSSFEMKLHINGNTSQLKYGDILYFKSNGKTWEELSGFVYSKKPEMQNVPVVTLVGYYDPQNKLNGFIAPALEGSNGMVYQSDTIIKKRTFLRVTLADGKTKDYQLNNKRTHDNKMNKFHVNIARSLTPVKSELFINGKLSTSKNIELSDENYFTTVNGVIQ
nr:hypothetical protein [Providencia stuartii]